MHQSMLIVIVIAIMTWSKIRPDIQDEECIAHGILSFLVDYYVIKSHKTGEYHCFMLLPSNCKVYEILLSVFSFKREDLPVTLLKFL